MYGGTEISSEIKNSRWWTSINIVNHMCLEPSDGGSEVGGGGDADNAYARGGGSGYIRYLYLELNKAK